MRLVQGSKEASGIFHVLTVISSAALRAELPINSTLTPRGRHTETLVERIVACEMAVPDQPL